MKTIEKLTFVRQFRSNSFAEFEYSSNIYENMINKNSAVHGVANKKKSM